MVARIDRLGNGNTVLAGRRLMGLCAPKPPYRPLFAARALEGRKQRSLLSAIPALSRHSGSIHGAPYPSLTIIHRILVLIRRSRTSTLDRLLSIERHPAFLSN